MSELTTNHRLEDVCAAREQVLGMLMQAQDIINDAHAKALAYGLGDVHQLFRDATVLAKTTGATVAHRSRAIERVGFTAADRETIARYIDTPAWERISKASGLVACMHTQARREWESQLARNEVMPFTLDNLHAAMGTVHDNRMGYLEDGVAAVFKSLSYDYKSNAPVKFGKRVVIDNFHGGRPNWYAPSPSSCDRVDDLLRLMRLADGSKEDVKYETQRAMSASKVSSAGSAKVENEYYVLTVYKKGTAHIAFKRLDLVEVLNRAVAKAYPNALPAPV